MKFFLSPQHLDLLLRSGERARPGAANLLYLQQILPDDRLYPATVGPSDAGSATMGAPRPSWTAQVDATPRAGEDDVVVGQACLSR